MPKVYYLLTEEGEEVTKCKGYSGKLSKAQYLELLDGNSLNLNITKWYRDLKTQSVRILKGQPYKINPTFNKRDKIIKEGAWIDTTPIVLNPKTISRLV